MENYKWRYSVKITRANFNIVCLDWPYHMNFNFELFKEGLNSDNLLDIL